MLAYHTEVVLLLSISLHPTISECRTRWLVPEACEASSGAVA